MENDQNAGCRDYERVASAIRFIEQHFEADPSLESIAEGVGLSSYHFERLFKRWAGTTPKRFVQCLRLGYAKSLLQEPASLFDTAWEAGFSSPSRMHDLFCTLEAVTPGEFKSGGMGLEIRYGVHETPFGQALVASTPRGLCRFAFLDRKGDRRGDRDAEVEVQAGGRKELERLAADWPRAKITRDPGHGAELIEGVFTRPPSPADARPLHLLVKGTNFQVQVWRALLEIPPGSVVSYQAVAQRVGRPTSARAVAGAIAANSIAYLIPCHRVLRATGAISGYRWGPERKRAILAWEGA